MNAAEATAAYEAWLGSQVPLVKAHVDVKHDEMAKDPFRFLRATFYLWAMRWPQVCPDLVDAPRVLGVGDLHVENYGTWRDFEGRLVWGINDFDEATELPYPSDLVRLATSVVLARDEGGVSVGHADACRAVLAGYGGAVRSDTRPFVLAEGHGRLRSMATGVMRNPAPFWDKLEKEPGAETVPAGVSDLLAATFPGPEGLAPRFLARVGGIGSLGRPRITAVAGWRGALVAREAKAMVPSAWDWAGHRDGLAGGGTLPRGRFPELLTSPRRCPDPWVSVHGDWLVRRLAPDCRRVELKDLPATRDEVHLLECMGRELANVHLGTPGAAAAVGLHLARRPDGWLAEAAGGMADSVRTDHRQWRRTWSRRNGGRRGRGHGPGESATAAGTVEA